MTNATAMAEPVLYSFRRCPYAMRARLALDVSETPVEHREVLLRDKPAAMLEASPKGTVPVLVLEDGRVLDESLDIMRWALAARDPQNWLGSATESQDLIATNDGPFKHHLDRYKYAVRYDDADPVFHREEALACLQELENRLARHANLCGDQMSLADAAIFPFVRQFANADNTWFDEQPIPRIRMWLCAHLASQRFERIMSKHPLWVPDLPSTAADN